MKKHCDDKQNDTKRNGLANPYENIQNNLEFRFIESQGVG